MTIITAFSVPIITTELTDCSDLNARLKVFFQQCASQGGRLANQSPHTHRNEKLFESLFNLFDWQHPDIAELRDFCFTELYKAIGELNGFDLETVQKLIPTYESWFHLTRRGGYFGIHNHAMHSWSGVYCVCQEGDEYNANSGLLTFVSPYLSSMMFTDLTTLAMQPPFQTANIPVRLKPGQLLLFPSWLLHEVTPFEPINDGLRITVAFNVRFHREDVRPLSVPSLFMKS